MECVKYLYMISWENNLSKDIIFSYIPGTVNILHIHLALLYSIIIV